MMIRKYLNEVKAICDSLDRDVIEEFIDYVKTVKKNKGRVFFVGVGGSAANCSHAVNDFRKILGIESYTPSDNVSELTARINDVGWTSCYSDWLKVSNLGEKDVVIVLSVGGGGNGVSENLVDCLLTAKIMGSKTLSIVSRDGGACKTHSDVCIMIPVVNSDRITPHAEEWQSILLHLIVESVR